MDRGPIEQQQDAEWRQTLVERRKFAGPAPSLPLQFEPKRWQGEPLAGKRLLVLPERTLGEELPFTRFIAPLIEAAAQVILLTPPPLMTVFRESFPAAQLIPSGGQVTVPPFDHWVATGALADLPLAASEPAPYLRTATKWGNPPRGFKIGMLDTVVATQPHEAVRSLPEQVVVELRRRLPGMVIDLALPAGKPVDMAQSAALISAVDLVISVDGWAAHLAGALNKPGCVLLPSSGHSWCWGKGERSPWYPSLELFRATGEDWGPAIDRLCAKVDRLAAGTANLAPTLVEEASALIARKEFELAIATLNKAIAGEPGNPAPLAALGRLMSHLGRLPEAERLGRAALATAPSNAALRSDLAHTLLARGQYAEGFRLHQARTELHSVQLGYPRGLTFPHWEGEDVSGTTVALFPEEGLGDQIQNIRFLPQLQEHAGRVVMVARPELARLFEINFPGVEVRPSSGDLDDLGADWWLTTSELPLWAGATLESLPPAPYIRAPGGEPISSTRPRIGLVTKGGNRHPRDAERSLNEELARRLAAALPGTILSLDPEQTGARDFADTAVIVDQLDFVVSVDTAIAHLAGALGKPCLLLVQGYATDWRWGRDRDDSPWYAGHRLYRGGSDGDWSGAIERLAQDARGMANW